MKIRLFAVVLVILTVFLMAPSGVFQAQSFGLLSLYITSPNNGALLFQSPIPVEGMINYPASGIASVTCNGNPATVEGNSFSCEVPLTQGANTINVTATDNEGHSTSSSIEVVLADIDQLIQTYGPVIKFHPEESYFPDDAEAVLDSSSLVFALVENPGSYEYLSVKQPELVQTSSESLVTDVINYKTNNPQKAQDSRFRYFLEVPDGVKDGNLVRATSYVRIRPWGSSYTDVQFHIYYPFNGPGRFWVNIEAWPLDYRGYFQCPQMGQHWSDWETVVLRFSNMPVQLAWIGLSRHGDMKWFTSGQLGSEASHPIVYSAKHSHALYPSAGSWDYKELFTVRCLWPCPDVDVWAYDLTSNGDRWETFQEDNYKIISSAIPGHDLTEPSWLGFQGDWGQPCKNLQDIIDTPVKNWDWREVNWGPNGPNMWGSWWPPTITISPDPAYNDTDLKANKSGWESPPPKEWNPPWPPSPFWTPPWDWEFFGEYLYWIAFPWEAPDDPPPGWFDPPPGWAMDFYQWQKWDGASWQDIPGETTATLDSSNFGKNDWIKVICYPWDWEFSHELEGRLIGAIEDTIIISNTIPVADANGPYSGNEGSPIGLNASGSSDTDGPIVLYEWDLDNDGEYDDALGEMVTAIFGDNGTFTVKLRVTDDEGATDEDEAAVTVENVAPTVDAGSDQTSHSGDLMSINAVFTDPGFLDTHTASIDWGDGETSSLLVTETNGSGNATGTHTYYLLDSYTVKVTVTDDDGASTTDTLIVTVIPKPVSIDIKPASDTNPINLKSRGVIPVAILTDDDFDATRVDMGTVQFGPAEIGPVHGAAEDVDGDGDVDVILHFRTQEVDLGEQDTEAILTGQTIDGAYFTSSDVVRIVPANNRPDPSGKDNAPGQNKEPGDNAGGKTAGREDAPGQNKELGDNAHGKAIGNDDASDSLK